MSPPADNEPAQRRVVTQISSIESLVGGHPAALRRMFGAGHATDPAELGDAPRGYLLAVEPGAAVFLALRPLLRALAGGSRGLFPWQGKTFDHGGNSGQNVVLGRKVLRFRAEGGPSQLDGRPALVLRYDAPAHGNPWPVRALRDELRTIGPGIAVGPVIAPHPLAGSLGGIASSPSSPSAPLVMAWLGLRAPR
jgi:hypothetical protein